MVSLKAQRITGKEMQEFMKRFHRAAGAPPRSELHIHPSASLNGFKDASELQTISSEAQMKSGGDLWKGDKRRFWGSEDWHTEYVQLVPFCFCLAAISNGPVKLQHQLGEGAVRLCHAQA